MKKECEIVQDLLFGYQDGTLHKASEELVEKHLKECEECKKVFAEMIKDKEDKSKQKQEIDYLKNVKRKMSKKNKLIVIIGIFLFIIILFNIGIFAYYYHEAGKVEIYLDDDITEEQLDEIRNTILGIDNNAKFEYYSKEDALNQMKEKFKDNGDLLSGYDGENNPMNAYIIVDTNMETVKEIVNLEESLQGIKKIINVLDTNPYLFIFSKAMIEIQNN